jgi:hypothetical protein
MYDTKHLNQNNAFARVSIVCLLLLIVLDRTILIFPVSLVRIQEFSLKPIRRLNATPLSNRTVFYLHLRSSSVSFSLLLTPLSI